MRSSVGSATPGIRVQVRRQDDDVIVVAVCYDDVSKSSAFELVVWHGGGYVDTAAAWRVRDTHKLLGFVQVGDG